MLFFWKQVSIGAIFLIFSSDLSSGSMLSESALAGNLLALGACVTQGIYFSLINYGASQSGFVELCASSPAKKSAAAFHLLVLFICCCFPSEEPDMVPANVVSFLTATLGEVYIAMQKLIFCQCS